LHRGSVVLGLRSLLSRKVWKPARFSFVFKEYKYIVEIWKTHISERATILYHFVCPIKNRRKVLWTKKRQQDMQEICWEIEENYELHFLEVWVDEDHVHFLLQWVSVDSPSKIIKILKSLTSRLMFSKNPGLRGELLWWSFWTSWYYVNTVWRFASEETIRNYVKNQWKEKTYERIHKSQLQMF
jgi:REP element-mobilizing transposase RayT